LPQVRHIEENQKLLVKLKESVELGASPVNVWSLLRDTPRLTGLMPGVESVLPLNNGGSEAYLAKVSDKIGPFRVTLNLEVRIGETEEASFMNVAIGGADPEKQNRITGSMLVVLSPVASGTQMDFEASVEVLGKLATLGAVPLRRRTTQLFGEFARNIQGQFAKERS
jgi:carbon monoxide dehydrogenase subunit G